MGKLAVESDRMTILSTGNLTKKTFVGFDGAVEATNSNMPLGVAIQDTTSGDYVPVQIGGIAVVTAGEAISTSGLEICTGTSGYAYKVTGSEKVIGYNVDTAAAAGDDITILIDRGQ